MSVQTLTVQTLDEDGLKVANTGLTFANCQGLGSSPDGDQFINDKDTFLAMLCDGHDNTVTVTVSPSNAALQTEGLGELTVPDVSVQAAASDMNPQTVYLKVPRGYVDAAGKVIAKVTSGTAFEAGEVKLAAVKLV